MPSVCGFISMSSLLCVSRRALEVSGGHCSVWGKDCGQYRGRFIPRLCTPISRALHLQHIVPLEGTRIPSRARHSLLLVKSHNSLLPTQAPGHSRCVPAEGQTAGDTQVNFRSLYQIAVYWPPVRHKDVSAPEFNLRVFPFWPERLSRVELSVGHSGASP